MVSSLGTATKSGSMNRAKASLRDVSIFLALRPAMSMYTIASRWAVIVSFVSSTKTSGGRSRIFPEGGEGVVSEDMSPAGCSILSERSDVGFVQFEVLVENDLLVSISRSGSRQISNPSLMILD